MHRLLKRQLKKLFGEITPNDESYQNLVDLIDDSYNQFQSDYNKLERILELSSKESFKELSNFKHAINSAALVSLADLKGNILMANENFCKISGYSLGELIGNNHSIINSGFHEPEFWKNMWAQVSSGKIWHAEVCNRKKSGENYWVDSSIIPFLNDEGKPYQYLSIRFDITSRKKIEKEIKTLALVARKTQNSVIITDKDVKTIWTNEGFERITGYSFNEIEGKNPGHLLQGVESDPKTIKEMSEAFRNVKPYSGEIVNYTKTGKKYWINFNITPIIENEEHIGFIAIESDITEKKEFELQLQENEEKFRLLIESATDIFYYSDSNGNFTYVNDIATQITGYTNQELLKMNYLDLVQPSHKNIVRQFYLKQAKKGQKVTYYEFPIVTKSGKNAWIGQNVQLFVNKNAGRGIQAIARDITSLKDAQLEIENSHNFLNQIINSIPSPLFVKDSEHNWVMVNDAYAKLTNIPKNDILGNKGIDFLPLEDAKIFMEQDDARLQIGEEMVREVTFKNSNNEEKILLVKKSIFYNQGKNYLIGVITDITEFKERENQILLYNKISDQISDAISVADYQGNLIYVNETHAQNLGKTKKDIIQSNVLEVDKIFPDIEAWHAHYDEIKQKGELLIEGENIRLDGSTFPVEASVKYIRLDDKGYVVATIRDITERKKNEEAVRKLKEFYETVLNKIPSEVVVFDKDHHYLFVNETAIKDKFKRDWIINHTDYEYCAHFNKPVRIAEERSILFKKVKELKSQLEFVEEVVTKEGSNINVLRRFYPILDGDNEILHIIGFGIDITSRIDAEKQTKESEERLKLATQSANLGIWDWDIQNDVLVWDESMHKIFGIGAEEFTHNIAAFKSLLHLEDLEKVDRELSKALNQGQDFSGTYRIIQQPATIKYITAFSKAFYNAEGLPIRMIGVNYDVTENTLIQQKILKQQQDLEEAQHIAKLGAWEIDVKTRTILWSKEMFSICECEVAFQPNLNETYALFTPQTREPVIQSFYNAIEKFEPFELEAQLKTKNNTIIDVKVKGIPAKEDNKIVTIRGIIQDITKEKEGNRLLLKYTEELEKKNKELDQFAYVVSHDLKAPLRGINNLNLWIEEDIGESIEGETKRNLALMRNRVKRMEGLIDGILQYSRAGRIKHEAITFNLKECLEELINSFSVPSNFKISISEKMPTLTTEKIAIEQVFSNYISNAIKYNSSAEPTIAITCQKKENFYEFCVEDNGPGIEKEFHEKIFVIFQTLQSRDTFESTGVGLAIVKKMVEEKGGRVWIESKKDAGSKFYFSWPIKEEEGEA